MVTNKINKNNYCINGINHSWKEENKEYLKEIQIFLDKAQNIQDEELKLSIINQMLKCDRTLTNISENLFEKYYIKGCNDSNKI